ncbi:MAG: competence/damage-inducible protein A, partial [Proteobacteria bacterium]|nr:competence/damage-inducible protein A [Pseudomonadota bacterium]
VAVGTELTSGELINTNSGWLSEKASDLGFTVVCHFTVPDDRKLIQMALKAATSAASIVFVTGGLGPTSDDFTRIEIAQFGNLELKWDEAAWNQVIEKLTSVGAPIVESNRQQCYFPEGSNILSNSKGTASGFYLLINDAELFVLPGPPAEIDAIWHDHLVDLLTNRIPSDQRKNLHRFICLGLSESKIGELVEQALQDSGLLTGYRTRVPYVDVKIWTDPHTEEKFKSQWRPRVLAALGKSVMGEGTFDAAVDFASAAPKSHQIQIFDFATGSLVAQRYLKTTAASHNLTFISASDGDSFNDDHARNVEKVVIAGSLQTGAWSVERLFQNQNQVFSESSRYKGAKNKMRFESYICERAFCILTAWWRDSHKIL